MVAVLVASGDSSKQFGVFPAFLWQCMHDMALLIEMELHDAQLRVLLIHGSIANKLHAHVHAFCKIDLPFFLSAMELALKMRRHIEDIGNMGRERNRLSGINLLL